MAKIQRAFPYAFRYEGVPAGPIPKLQANLLSGEPFELFGLVVTPIPTFHGRDITVGYRIANIAYLTDHNEIPEASMEMLGDLDLLFLDALRHRPHATHTTVERALQRVKWLKPKRTLFTHMCHDLGHAETEAMLPPEVRLAYDGMKVEMPIRGFRTFRSLEEAIPFFGPAGVCIGNFDGVHFGHQSLFELVKQAKDKGLKPSVLTFDPHPAKLLVPDRAPKLLTTIPERLEWMRAAGIEQVLVLPFDDSVQHLNARDFIRQVLVRLGTKLVIVGENFRFGHKLSGDVKTLMELGPQFGFEAQAGESVLWRGGMISSSNVRKALWEGDVLRAGRLLGRFYSITGTIVSGHGIGSKQTVPTLNMTPESELPPANGVYVTRVQALEDGRSWTSITNIGVRPTFGIDPERSIETFLLDPFDGNDPVRIRLTFYARLRDERTFGSPEELKTQILKDVQRARALHRRLQKWTPMMQRPTAPRLVPEKA
jgi:riboflavin kinase/FMN adenylyltransferase